MFTYSFSCFRFFHIGEIRNIALRDVSIHSDHMSVYLPQRKNDQYREGHTAFLARTGKVTCPVAVTERLIKLLPQSSSAFPLVCRIVKLSLRSIFIFDNSYFGKTIGKTLK